MELFNYAKNGVDAALIEFAEKLRDDKFTIQELDELKSMSDDNPTPETAYFYGMLYLYGRVVPYNLMDAEIHLLMVINADASRHQLTTKGAAAYALHKLHRMKVSPDAALADEFLTMSSNCGYPPAQNEMALWLLARGREVNFVAAQGLFTTAANNGNAPAMVNLANLIRQTDPPGYLRWISTAAYKGNPIAKQALERA
jgi:TPR repeat protein